MLFKVDITNRLTFFATLFQVDKNAKLGMWLLYLTIVILTIIAYKLGFSHKLSRLKSAIIYLVLILGCTILTFLGVILPIAEGLLVMVVVLLIYKLRRRNEVQQGSKSKGA